MQADVTNRSRGARGFELDDGSTRFVEPGETVLLDLADNPLHRAWEMSGEVRIALVAPPDEPPATSAPAQREKGARRHRSG